MDTKDYGINTHYQDLQVKYDTEERCTKHLKSFAGIMVLSVVVIFACIFVGYRIQYGISLALAIAFGVAALVFYFVSKKTQALKLLNPLFNSIAIGLAIASFFNHQNYNPSVQFLGLFAGSFLAFNIALWLCVTLLPFKKTMVGINIFLAILSIILSCILWKNNPMLYSLLLFMSIFYLGNAAAYAYYALNTKSEFWPCVFVGYSLAAIVIIFIVLVIVSEGEALSGIDFGTGGGKEKIKDKKLKRFK